MTRLSLLICLLSLAFPGSSPAQYFQSVNDAFPFARTNCIYQDDYGFMWFGTRDGLVKFDGYSTQTYRRIPGDPYSLPGQEVYAVAQISDSLLFVGLRTHGLIVLSRNTGKCRQIHLSDNNCHVHAIATDTSGVVWVGTSTGLYLVEHTDPSIDSIIPVHVAGFEHHNILELYCDRRGVIWVGTDKGIYRLGDKHEAVDGPDVNNGFPGYEVVDIGEDRKGRLWLTVAEGAPRLYYWDDARQIFIPDNRLDQDIMYKFSFDASDKMWISAHGTGVYRLGPDLHAIYTPARYWEHGLRGMFTGDIMADKYNNIWVQGDNVYIVPAGQKPFYGLETEGFNAISIYADNEYIWHCSREPRRWSRNTGLSESLFPKGSILQTAAEPPRVYRFQAWGDALVMSTLHSLVVWNRRDDTFQEYPTEFEGAFRDFVIDHNGLVWIPGENGTPICMELNTGRSYRFDKLSDVTGGCTVTRSPDGVQWWGTYDHGVYQFSPNSGRIQHYTPDPKNPATTLSSAAVNDILYHADGTVWIATQYRLNRLDPAQGTIRQYPLQGDHVNENIVSIQQDAHGALWLGTQNGIVYLNPETDSMRHFTVDDGLRNSIYTPRACFMDARGYLYFGGLNGIDYFHPDQFETNTIPPDLYIKSLRVNNVSHTQNVAGESLHALDLAYNENFIEIELVGVQMASRALKYAYRMSTQSQEWIDLGRNRVITLANLSAGEYMLEGKCANADGIWSEPKRLINIAIRPPFWKAPWFVLLMGLAIGGIVLSVYRFRVRRIRNAEQLKSAFSKQIAEIEMKALRAQMNPHFLFNSLNSLKLLIDEKKISEANSYLTKYSQLIRQILSNSRKKFIRLDEELKTIRLYLDLEQLRFKNFEYVINVGEDVEVDFLDIPPLLLQPFIENAIWHGLMNKRTGTRNLVIDVDRKKDFVLITIEDNGIGRRQAQLLKTRSSTKRESLGLKISEDRLKFLREMYGTDAYVRIIDLEDPTGTRVVIHLPIPE